MYSKTKSLIPVIQAIGQWGDVNEKRLRRVILANPDRVLKLA